MFTHKKAEQISRAATAQGRDQGLCVRVNKAGDEIFRGMVGGWTEENCVEAVAALNELPGVHVAALTAFPSTSYRTRDPATPSPPTPSTR